MSISSDDPVRQARIDLAAALRAYTLNGAWLMGQEQRVGSIEVGKRADLVVLSGNPMNEPDVRDLKVERTVIDGATVYRRP